MWIPLRFTFGPLPSTLLWSCETETSSGRFQINLLTIQESPQWERQLQHQSSVVPNCSCLLNELEMISLANRTWLCTAYIAPRLQLFPFSKLLVGKAPSFATGDLVIINAVTQGLNFYLFFYPASQLKLHHSSFILRTKTGNKSFHQFNSQNKYKSQCSKIIFILTKLFLWTSEHN